jgi:hypothetical protein
MQKPTLGMNNSRSANMVPTGNNMFSAGTFKINVIDSNELMVAII